jgi:glycosyltransferase involved in cell wall biosynthesis
MPEVTVVIPTRSRWERLSRRALPSALAQEGVDVEVIVVDDGSTDETVAHLDRLHEHPALRVRRHATAQGVAHARNTGIEAARGEWVAFLDDDDVWSPRKLRAQLDVAGAAKASFVYSPAVYAHAGSLEFASAPDPGSVTASVLAGEAVPAGGSNVMVTTSAIRGIGGFDDGFVHLTDFDCWIRLGRVCRAARCQEPLVAYMQDPGVMHLRNAHRVLGDVRRLHRKYRAEYEALGRGFDGEGFLVWIAHQHQAAGEPAHAAWIYLVTALRYRPITNLARAAAALSGERGIAMARRLRSGTGDPNPSASSAPGNAEEMEAALTWLAPYLR